jgi:hypothetical protein
VHRDGHAPVTGAQGLLQCRQYDRIAVQFGQLPLPVECVVKPLQVASGLSQVGLLHLDEMQAHTGIQRYIPVLRFLANDLAVHLALGGHVDDQVALDRCLAAQAVVLLERHPALAKALLDLAGRRKVFGA